MLFKEKQPVAVKRVLPSKVESMVAIIPKMRHLKTVNRDYRKSLETRKIQA